MRTSRFLLAALVTAIASGCGVSLLGTDDSPPVSADGGVEGGGGVEAGADVVADTAEAGEADGSTETPDTGCGAPTTPGCSCGVVCASKTCSRGACDPLVFVGSTMFSPKFGMTGAASVAAADAACETLAAGIQRTPKVPFRAWFSANGVAVSARFVKSSRPYRVNDTGRSLVATDFRGLADDLKHAINVTENGSVVDGLVWTGTSRDGTWTGNDCNAWSTNQAPSDTGSVGRTSLATASWSRDTEAPCDNNTFHLYCFEQLP